MSRRIRGNHRVIIAICKHIVPQDALAGGSEGIAVQESPDDGVIISALQVIETGFGIAVVTSVAQGVEVGDGQVAKLCAGDTQDVAPGVVGILRHGFIGAVHQLDHVALGVENIVIGGVIVLGLVEVAPHGQGVAGFVVGEVQHILEGSRGGVCHLIPHDLAVLGDVLMPLPICELHAPHARHVVLIAVSLAALGDAAQSAPLGPGQVGIFRSVVPVFRVAAVSALISYTSFTSLSSCICLPAVFLSARAERKQRHARGERFRIR